MSRSYRRAMTMTEPIREVHLYTPDRGFTAMAEDDPFPPTRRARPRLSLLNWIFEAADRRYRLGRGFEIDAAPRNWPR